MQFGIILQIEKVRWTYLKFDRFPRFVNMTFLYKRSKWELFLICSVSKIGFHPIHLNKYKMKTLKNKILVLTNGWVTDSFTGSTLNPKKISGIPNQPIRTMCSTLKKKRSQTFVWGLPDEICPGSLQKQ
jgi:hypothetical protein